MAKASEASSQVKTLIHTCYHILCFQVAYKFISLASVHTLKAGKLVYVIGLVVDEGCLLEVPCKGKDVAQRDVTLASRDGSMKLTLWAKDATDFCHEGRVIAVRGALVKVFRGLRNLTLPPSGSYEVEPEGVRGVSQLVTWGREERRGDSEVSSLQDSLKVTLNYTASTIFLLLTDGPDP